MISLIMLIPDKSSIRFLKKEGKKNRFWATKLREDEVGCFASGGEANELTWLFLWKKVTHITRETRGKPFINVLTRVASIS